MSDIDRFQGTIHSTPATAKTVHNRIVSLVEKRHFAMRELFGVGLASEETLTNAIKHGNQMDPNKSVHIICRTDEHRIRIVIEDEGQGLQVNDVPDPAAEENLTKPCGRGIMLVRSFMSLV